MPCMDQIFVLFNHPLVFDGDCTAADIAIMGYVADLKDGFRAFTPQERRNIAIYIAGIMIYKFGLEAFNGSVVALATNRYDYESIQSGRPSRTFERVGLLTGLNQACQCIGSILIGPLVKRYPTKNVLACAVLVFGLCSALLLIIDAATGGTFMPAACECSAFQIVNQHS